jgi:hypothetical protein
VHRAETAGHGKSTELNNFSLGVFGEPTEGVYQLHLLDRIAAGAKKKGRTDEISQALRVGDCCVEAIAAEKKCETARNIFAARSCYRNTMEPVGPEIYREPVCLAFPTSLANMLPEVAICLTALRV